MPPDSPAARSLESFIQSTSETDKAHGVFEQETERLLEVNLDGRINMKKGAMVAYEGDIRFTREGALDQGMGGLLKKAVSGEGMQITYADGQGKLYLADQGKKVSIIQLNGESLFVNGNDILAFETSLDHKITMMRKMAAMLSGGLFNIHLSGHGLLAVTSHYEPRTLRVRPGQPVFTDPSATVAWSGNLNPECKADVSLRSFVGRGSGDSIQLKFEGDGFVVIQPFEEIVMEE